MKRPETGEILHPGSEPTTEEIAVPLGGEAALWLAEELGGLRERVVILESGPGRDRSSLVLRGICAVVGAVSALLGVGLVLLTSEATALSGWTLAACVALAGGVCALPALVALGLEDELVEITRLVLSAWATRKKEPMVVAPTNWSPGPPPGWRGP